MNEMKLSAHPAMTVGTLAREAGIGVETVRYYEREGLLPEPPRTLSNYRKYPPEALERLNFIRRAKDLGFSLGEIRELLRLSQSRSSAPADFHRVAQQKIEWIDRRIRDLQSMRTILSEAVETCPQASKDCCRVLELFREKHGSTQTDR